MSPTHQLDGYSYEFQNKLFRNSIFEVQNSLVYLKYKTACFRIMTCNFTLFQNKLFQNIKNLLQNKSFLNMLTPSNLIFQNTWFRNSFVKQKYCYGTRVSKYPNHPANLKRRYVIVTPSCRHNSTPLPPTQHTVSTHIVNIFSIIKFFTNKQLK